MSNNRINLENVLETIFPNLTSGEDGVSQAYLIAKYLKRLFSSFVLVIMSLFLLLTKVWLGKLPIIIAIVALVNFIITIYKVFKKKEYKINAKIGDVSLLISAILWLLTVFLASKGS